MDWEKEKSFTATYQASVEYQIELPVWKQNSKCLWVQRFCIRFIICKFSNFWSLTVLKSTSFRILVTTTCSSFLVGSFLPFFRDCPVPATINEIERFNTLWKCVIFKLSKQTLIFGSFCLWFTCLCLAFLFRGIVFINLLLLAWWWSWFIDLSGGLSTRFCRTFNRFLLFSCWFLLLSPFWQAFLINWLSLLLGFIFLIFSFSIFTFVVFFLWSYIIFSIRVICSFGTNIRLTISFSLSWLFLFLRLPSLLYISNRITDTVSNCLCNLLHIKSSHAETETFATRNLHMFCFLAESYGLEKVQSHITQGANGGSLNNKNMGMPLSK